MATMIIRAEEAKSITDIPMIIESTFTIDRSHFAELARVVAIFVENTVVPHIATPHTINETNTEMSMLFLQRLDRVKIYLS
jgi:predicted transcriptional regulator